MKGGKAPRAGEELIFEGLRRHLKGENAPRAGEELILEGLRRHLKGEEAPRAGEELILEGLQVRKGIPCRRGTHFGRPQRSQVQSKWSSS